MDEVNWNDYYTPEQAAAKLTDNSGKTISRDYLRSLVRDGVFHVRKIGNVNMYPRVEVDGYTVGARGDTLRGERRKKAIVSENAETSVSRKGAS